jgi:DNA-binding FadR family transcriptional regulator
MFPRANFAAVRPPGTGLPPSRSLAADLGIARSPVAESYSDLVAEGWLTARQGSGTRVAKRPHEAFGIGDALGRVELRTALAGYPSWARLTS